VNAALDLWWIPLGAGGHLVRLNGLVYEAAVARAKHRPRRELYHAALVAHLPEGCTTVEVAPAWDHTGGAGDHGAVMSGPVGLRVLGQSRWFRYEVRCWHDGVIPDLDAAVGGPLRLTDDDDVVRRALAATATVPTLTWGRDELGLGEMWNSNSVIAWVLLRAGIEVGRIRPPAGGRAPGFYAGVVAAELGVSG
jgi:hypothetical protein